MTFKASMFRYIIVTIDYLTKWAKSKFVVKNDARSAKYLYENIFDAIQSID